MNSRPKWCEVNGDDIQRKLRSGDKVTITGDMEEHIIQTLSNYQFSPGMHVCVKTESQSVVKLGFDSKEVIEHLVRLTKTPEEVARWDAVVAARSGAKDER